MRREKNLFLLQDDLKIHGRRIMIDITDEDEEFFIGEGDNEKKYALRKSNLYKIQRGKKGISVFGFDECMLYYLIFKYGRDVQQNSCGKDDWFLRLEKQFSHILCKNLSDFFNDDDQKKHI